MALTSNQNPEAEHVSRGCLCFAHWDASFPSSDQLCFCCLPWCTLCSANKIRLACPPRNGPCENSLILIYFFAHSYILCILSYTTRHLISDVLVNRFYLCHHSHPFPIAAIKHPDQKQRKGGKHLFGLDLRVIIHH